MCKCTPSIRTPFCGKPGCEWPEQRPDGARDPNKLVEELRESADRAANFGINCVLLKTEYAAELLTHIGRLEAEKAELKAKLEAYTSTLFDGWAVFNGLSETAQTRTNIDNVSDTLNAFARVCRAEMDKAAQEPHGHTS